MERAEFLRTFHKIVTYPSFSLFLQLLTSYFQFLLLSFHKVRPFEILMTWWQCSGGWKCTFYSPLVMKRKFGEDSNDTLNTPDLRIYLHQLNLQCSGGVHLKRCSGNGAVPSKTAVSRALERDSSEEASLSTTTASPDLISVLNTTNTTTNNNNLDRTHFDRRKLRSASADRILENGASRCLLLVKIFVFRAKIFAVLRSREVAESPSPVAQSWQSWGLERRRQWRRSLSGSQSLAHVGYSLQPVRWYLEAR